MDDNYPNNGDNLQTSDIEGWTPDVDKDQKLAESKENAKLASSIGIVQDVMDWLKFQAELHRGTDQIEGLNPSTDAEDFKTAGLLNQGLHRAFTKKLEDFRVEYDRYITETPIE